MDPTQISATLGLSIIITPSHSWRYSCMFSLYPLGLNYPITRVSCFSGCLHTSSSLPLHLWMLQNFSRLLMSLHVERSNILPLNHHISSIFLAPQICACILYLKCINILDSNPDLLHLSRGYMSHECLSFAEDHIITTVFQNYIEMIFFFRPITNMTCLSLRGDLNSL